jgi:hypothetical protein
MNYSVTHKDAPEKKGFVRAQSLLTGFIVVRTLTGCKLMYLTQTDVKGWIPAWLVSYVTKQYAPRLLENLYQAALKYPEWKSRNNPQNKPWRV